MQRLFKVFFIILVLAWGAASLRHAQGQRGRHQDASPGAAFEIFDTGDKTAPASARIAWVASQSVTWAKDSEVEE